MEGEYEFTFDEWKAYTKVKRALDKDIPEKEPEPAKIEPASREEIEELLNRMMPGQYKAPPAKKIAAELSKDEKTIRDIIDRVMR